MRILYVICVIIPLVLTDGLVLTSVVKAEEADRLHEMENTAEAVTYELTSQMELASLIAGNISINQYVREYLDTRYKDPLDYFIAYDKFTKDTLFTANYGSGRLHITMYADNETIVNGGFFGRVSSIKDTEWYKTIDAQENDERLLFYYDTWNSPAVAPERRAVLIRRMNRSLNRGYEKIIKVDIKYSMLAANIANLKLADHVYVVKDGDVIFTNDQGNKPGLPFDRFVQPRSKSYSKEVILFGEPVTIYVVSSNTLLDEMRTNVPLLIMLIAFNVVFPLVFMNLIESSLISRITRLGNAFNNKMETLRAVNDVTGKDEIGMLMRNYNRMVERQNKLVENAYRGRLKAQEAGLAQQRAELLALYSQINPHFLFNALENIRMQSIIKPEYVTADMIGKLAIMERQYVDWSQDKVEMSLEIELMKSYLELQKYRFGDRLSYEVDMDDDCAHYVIPKLSLVTFVENACVHGIEKKSDGGWIFVRVNKENGRMIIEIEDTGIGFEEDVSADLKKSMNEADIDMLREKKSIGILNDCLRIKMITDDTATFDLESEKLIGTTFTIRIPVSKLKKGGENDA